MPASSSTSTETRRAAGAAPAYPGAAPAATPATQVPWPSPSPGEFGAAVAKEVLATTRPARSGRVASMPESTTAIVGIVEEAGRSREDHSCAFPEAEGHSWDDEKPVG